MQAPAAACSDVLIARIDSIAFAGGTGVGDGRNSMPTLSARGMAGMRTVITDIKPNMRKCRATIDSI
jgi:hypothetical protein